MTERRTILDVPGTARMHLINARCQEAYPYKPDEEEWPQSGFYVEAVDQHHVRITDHGNYTEANSEERQANLNRYAETLKATGQWRDVKVTNRAIRPNEVRATHINAPKIEHLATRGDYRAFAMEHGLSSPHDTDTKARIIGTILSNAGTTWDPREGEASALYMFVVYTVDGADAAYVSLAKLHEWAFTFKD